MRAPRSASMYRRPAAPHRGSLLTSLSFPDSAAGETHELPSCGLHFAARATPEEVLTIVKMGFKLRATHETKMNAVSSRSHTVFTLTIVQKDHRTGDTITGMLNLVDLGGAASN